MHVINTTDPKYQTAEVSVIYIDRSILLSVYVYSRLSPSAV